MDIDFRENIDIYEVEKRDYESYFYRLPVESVMKTRPVDGLTVYVDTLNNQAPLCGVLTENVMMMNANRYFIFNFMDEERLGPHKAYKEIILDEDDYREFLNRLQELTKERKEDA